MYSRITKKIVEKFEQIIPDSKEYIISVTDGDSYCPEVIEIEVFESNEKRDAIIKAIRLLNDGYYPVGINGKTGYF